jgi:uncharacterized protein YktB (UPF0637 family)
MVPWRQQARGGDTVAVTAAMAGFVPEDFAVFELAGFEERMRALRERLRPRLVALAEELAPVLSERVGATLYPHVAAHLRRTVNPPPETWAAFGPDPRRYKAFAHYAVGVDAGGVWLRLVLKDEASDDRRALAALLSGTGASPVRRLPADMQVVWAQGARPARSAPAPGEVDRLLRRQGAQWAVGRDVARDRPELARADTAAALALDTFASLAAVWRALPSAPWSRAV